MQINEISYKVKECKQLLENLNYNKQLMEHKMSTMNTTEWKNACSNLFSIKVDKSIIFKDINVTHISYYIFYRRKSTQLYKH